MKKELEKKLFEKYPEIFAQKDLPKTQTLMCWGFECGDGWYELIDMLCACIQHHIKYNVNETSYKPYGKPLSKYWWKSLVKQLRLALAHFIDPSYFKVTKENIQVEAVQVKEKFGTLRFYYNGGNEYIDGLVSFAESMSSIICENCGQPGKTNDSGWRSTLCSQCRSNQEQERIDAAKEWEEKRSIEQKNNNEKS